MKTKILVTGAGGPAGYATIRTLKDEYDLHAVDASELGQGLYMVEPEKRALVPFAKEANFLNCVLKLVEEWGIDLLIPTVDDELPIFSSASEKFLALGCKVLTNTEQSLKRTLDKAVLMQICESKLPVPSTVLGSQNKGLDPALRYIVKPRQGSGGRGVRCVEGVDLVTESLDDDVIIQEYLPGEEYSVDVFATNKGEVLASVPRVRLKVDSGISVVGRTVRDKLLSDLAQRAVESVGLTGICNVQFRRDENGVPKLLEINPRVPGSIELTIASGVNMPKLLVMEAMGLQFPKNPKQTPFKEIAMVRTLNAQVVELEHLGDVVTHASDSSRKVA